MTNKGPWSGWISAIVIAIYIFAVIVIANVLTGCQTREDAYWGSVATATGKVVNHGR